MNSVEERVESWVGLHTFKRRLDRVIVILAGNGKSIVEHLVNKMMF